MNELLPCPFCRGEAEAVHEIDGFWTVECVKCGALVDGIAAWNSRAKLGSEPPYDELLRCIENDWNISATWDGLRKFWNIELTEEGVRLRDAERGTLTAEQVREATYAHSIHADCADADWQAIADELNSRAERTCEIEHVKGGARYDVWRCSACGYEYAESVSEKGIVQNYCPNCGRRCI